MVKIIMMDGLPVTNQNHALEILNQRRINKGQEKILSDTEVTALVRELSRLEPEKGQKMHLRKRQRRYVRPKHV
jgi:hypothetical protein